MRGRNERHPDLVALRALPVQPESFQAICNQLDETDRWLGDGAYAGGFGWVDAGLDIAFDPESRSEYRALVADPQRRSEKIERHALMAERVMNFDF